MNLGKCDCGGQLFGVEQFGRVFTVCKNCTPKLPKPKTPNIGQAIGLELLRVRLDAGLKQYSLAARLGVTSQYLSLLERGGRRPSVEFLEKMAAALGMRLVIKFER